MGIYKWVSVPNESPKRVIHWCGFIPGRTTWAQGTTPSGEKNCKCGHWFIFVSTNPLIKKAGAIYLKKKVQLDPEQTYVQLQGAQFHK